MFFLQIAFKRFLRAHFNISNSLFQAFLCFFCTKWSFFIDQGQKSVYIPFRKFDKQIFFKHQYRENFMNKTEVMSIHQMPEIIVLPTESFIAIDDNPVQRDTETRAKAANIGKGHLRHSHPAHTMVSMALMVDKETDTMNFKRQQVRDLVLSPLSKTMKLDGHTRSHLWATGNLEKPPFVKVAVYFVDDIQQAKDFYRVYDSGKAVETGGDKVFSALRDAFGRKPVNKLWKRRGVKVALEVAFNGNKSMSDDQLFAFHKTDTHACHALKQIDEHKGLNLSAMKAPMMAAMFLSVLRDGPSALEFWDKYSNDGGYQMGGKMCPVKMASSFLDEINVMGALNYKGSRPNYIFTGFGRDTHNVYTPMFLDYYEMWKLGKMYTVRKNKTGIARRTSSRSTQEFLHPEGYKGFVSLLFLNNL